MISILHVIYSYLMMECRRNIIEYQLISSLVISYNEKEKTNR